MDRVETVSSPTLLGARDPRAIMEGLAVEALRSVDVDRCTLTSIDRGVMRVEVTRERDGHVPSFAGAEFSLDAVEQHPLLREAVENGAIVTGPGFAATGQVDAEARSDVARMHRVAIVPLLRDSTVMALLILSRAEEREFERTELERVQQIGAMAVLALHNARLLEQVEGAQGTALDTLTRISRLVAASDDRTSFFEKMTETVADIVGAGRAAFWVIEDGWLVARPSRGFSADQLHGMRLRLELDSQLRLSRVLAGEAVRFNADDFDDADLRALVELMEVHDGLAVPWRTADQPIGVLMAYDARAGWGEQEEWLLRLAARSSALVWQGYESERLATELSGREVGRLADYAASVASLDEQKSEFLRLASHELRTPMTLVRGYLSMLEDGSLGVLPPEAARVIPIMSARMTQMSQLVEQMLAASRAQEAGLEVEVSAVDVDALTRSAASALEGLLSDGHRLVVDGVRGTQALVDAEKTEVIVSNLISNAIKYSPSGGTVEVRVEPHGSEVRIAVRDEGIGIDAGDLPALFRPFGRLQTPGTESIEGTGLGLYLARRLAHLQHGEIEVDSTPGQGSTFTLVVPAARES